MPSGHANKPGDVVTSMSGDQPVGMTCQSFSSVSLEPPLVMFCPAKTSRAWPAMQRAVPVTLSLPSDSYSLASARTFAVMRSRAA